MNKIRFLLLVSCFLGCGGAPAPKAPTSAPASSAPMSDSTQQISEASEIRGPSSRSQAPSPAAPPPRAEAPVADAKKDRADDKPSGAIGSAIADFERAASGVRGARDGAPDCKGACRSLLSMERAASHLCVLTRGTREDYRCADAESRVREERKQIKSSCGTCPIGQSLDPNAPLPPP